MILRPVVGAVRLWTEVLHEPTPAIALVLMCVLYVRGTRRRSAGDHRGPARRVRRVRAFAIGIATLAIALASPLDVLADDLFAAHMGQHLLLAAVAPPFIVASDALLGMFRALPRRVRRRIGRSIAVGTVARRFWRATTSFAIALPLHVVAVLAWHLPALYQAALENPWLHGLEHLSFLGTGCLLWWRMLRRAPHRRTLGEDASEARTDRALNYAQGIAALFAVMMISGVLGALIVVADRLWYPLQEVRAPAWGLTPLDDQRVAGLLMWVAGGLIYVVEIGVLFMRWFHAGERRLKASVLS